MSEHQIHLARLLVEAVIAVVLIGAMTWIVIEPQVSDESSKAALVIVGSAIGFLFGRHTA